MGNRKRPLLGPRGTLEQEVRQVLRRALVAEGTLTLAQPADDLAPPEDGEQEAPALLIFCGSEPRGRGNWHDDGLYERPP